MGADVGEAAVVCGAWGHDHPVAQVPVYLRCSGMVLRCPVCSNAEIVLVEIDHRIELTMRGLGRLEFPSTARGR